MALLYINARCKQILNLLLSQNKYITTEQIGAEMKVSKRTVYYDICKINLWLQQAELPELEVVREKGLLIPHGERAQIQEMLESDEHEQVYIFSPKERVKIIICCVIYEKEAVYLEQLTDCCEVSRNTIFSDLKEVANCLEPYDLKLEYQARKGYYLTGDPMRIRALFILYFNEMMALFNGGTVRFFRREEIEGGYESLKEIERSLGITYVDGALLSLAALLPVMYHDKYLLKLEGLKETEIAKTRECELVRQYFPDLPLEEQVYLSLHLLGSRVNIVPDDYFESHSRQYIHDLTRSLISDFEKVACIFFEQKEELERALFVHLNTSMYRYKFGVQIGNIIGDDVIHEYPELFALTRIAAGRLEEHIGFPIPDSEIAYLALHFGAFLKISRHENDRLRIMIVCVNGISTGNMLKREIQKLLPFAEIVDVRAVVDLVNVQKICDLIISTVKIHAVVPVITVHPILTEFDRNIILNHRIIAPKSVAARRDRLFRVIKKYVQPKDYENLLDDLTAFIQNQTEDGGQEEHQENDLMSILDASRIHRFEHADSWQDSIRLAGQCLLDYKSIEKRYLDTIISQLQYYGPYMFLTEDVILAHAKPEDGVNCLDLSMAVFRETVAYSGLRKAKLVLVLAAEDQEKHLKILQDILQLLSRPDFINRVEACGSSAETYCMIRQLLA
ncbi:MAG: BglG family transcription antiterminator [Lachnospiraceae bacterium]|nr:BglG family transcription antiterminator [Lachnospiraceae bacterium]